MTFLIDTTVVADLIAQNALFVVNHSGGKDSQAMMAEMLKVIPASQMVVIHADLGEVEWEGAKELAAKQAADAGVDFIVALPWDKTGATKGIISEVERKFAAKPGTVPYPSAKNRWCTSDLKRTPIERETRRYMKAKGLKLAVNCEGLRAQESDKRAKCVPFQVNAELSKAGRQVFDWLPIHSMQLDQVWTSISEAGQAPHWAYAAGNERLSCVFCVMGSKNDLINGAKHRPDLFAKYVEIEERTGYVWHESRKSLRELVGDAVALAA